MSDVDDNDLASRAREMDMDWLETLKEESGGAGGCMELAEALSAMREDSS
jgi:hypothetical protein